VELVVLAPFMILFVLVVLALGRFELGRDQVVQGARAAADAAAVADSPAAAQSAAFAAASPELASIHSCRHPTVTVDTRAFLAGSEVRVTVACRVDFSDLLIPGMPGSAVIQSAQVAAFDPYRAVG
jgi:Flp pilus assembly protein TadG